MDGNFIALGVAPGAALGAAIGAATSKLAIGVGLGVRSFGRRRTVFFANFSHLDRTCRTSLVSPCVANVRCEISNLLVTQPPSKCRHLVWQRLLLCGDHLTSLDDYLQNCVRISRLYGSARLESRKGVRDAASAREMTANTVGGVESLAPGDARLIDRIDLNDCWLIGKILEVHRNRIQIGVSQVCRGISDHLGHWPSCRGCGV